jgi:tripartite-type tricarboxylate transporter receptor subunit TctC
MNTRNSAIFALALLAAPFGTVGAAVSFPTQPVNVIVPFPPGGIADQLARPLAHALEQIWKQPVVVHNRPGAGGGIGMASVAKAKPDGHTILVTTTAMSVIPAADAVSGRTPMIQLEQFAPLARISADPIIFVVRGESPWKTMGDFVEAAKARPNQLSYASSGIYGPIHIPGEMMAHAAGIRLNHVPYTGGGPMITALLGSHVDSTYGGPGTLAPHIRAGTFRPLAHTGDKRIALFPDVPTMRESGVDMEYYLWAGVFTSSGVPTDILAKLQEGLAQASKDPAFVAQMNKFGVPIQFQGPDEFARFLKSDATGISAAIQRIGKIAQ